jgi:hypothetical protein
MPYKDPEVKKAKHAEYSKTYYEKHKEKIISKNSVRRKKIVAEFAAFKATKSCIKCGESHPATLDFHHTDPQKTDKKVYELAKDGHFWLRIMREIDKCVVLCSNCHRIHHYEERKNKRKIVATSLK